jgi:lipoyl-dependent peroxiredoxin
MVARSARAIWHGPLLGTSFAEPGDGAVSLASVKARLPMRWSTRIAEHSSEATPEELLAGALAADYVQCLSHKLEERGQLSRGLCAEATFRLEPVESGRRSLTSASLLVRGDVDLDLEAFRALTKIAYDECFLVLALKIPIALTAELWQAGELT